MAEEKVKKCYSLPKWIVEKLQNESDERGLNMSVIVQLALESYFEKKEGKSNE